MMDGLLELHDDAKATALLWVASREAFLARCDAAVTSLPLLDERWRT
jgi:hypothetical protein